MMTVGTANSKEKAAMAIAGDNNGPLFIVLEVYVRSGVKGQNSCGKMSMESDGCNQIARVTPSKEGITQGDCFAMSLYMTVQPRPDH